MSKQPIIISIIAVIVVVVGYFVVKNIPPSFPPEQPIPPVAFDTKPNPGDIVIDPKYIFEIGKSFTLSGVPLPNNSNFAPIYTENNVLQHSIFQIRIRQLWSNACDRSPDMKDCPFQGEKMVRLEFNSPQATDLYLTDNSRITNFIYSIKCGICQ